MQDTVAALGLTDACGEVSLASTDGSQLPVDIFKNNTNIYSVCIQVINRCNYQHG
jgi:hypothetical protein